MRPGSVVAVGSLLAAGAVDVALIVATDGEESITGACQDHPVVTAVVIAAFSLHLLDVLGRCDPFRAIGSVAFGIGRRLHR